MDKYNNFYIRTVDYSDQLTACFKARYQVYCKERKWIPAEDCPKGLEKDGYDKISKHIIVFNEYGQIKGYTRFILKNKNSILPVTLHPGMKDKKIITGNTGEISRFITLEKEFRTAITYILIRGIYQLCMKLNYDYCYNMVELAGLRYLKRIGYICESLSDPHLYFGNYTVPVKVSIKDTKKNFEKLEHIYGDWFFQTSSYIPKDDFIFQYLYHTTAA